jgi:hypothetical protein
MQELKVQPECIPCFFRQVVIALKDSPIENEGKIKIMQECLREVAYQDLSRTPAHATTFVHRRVRELLGYDPFLEKKRKFNQIALGLYPELKRIITSSRQPLRTAVRLAIAGNVIDFGIFAEIDIEGELQKALSVDMPFEEYEALEEALTQNDEILYLLDNAGEIVFDRLLIEFLQEQNKKVIAVVKGAPVINDATMEDAIEIGLTEVCTVVENGSDGIGTILEWCSEEFRKRFLSASLIISKGQGNFETLSTAEKNIFFLFQVKCEVVATFIGVSIGERLLVGTNTLREHLYGLPQVK